MIATSKLLLYTILAFAQNVGHVQDALLLQTPLIHPILKVSKVGIIYTSVFISA
jgi:hypothetical protein